MSRLALVAGLLAACRPTPTAPPISISTETRVTREGDRLAASSLVTDGEVRLRGVRGETLGVLVALPEPPSAAPSLRIEGVEVRAHAIEMVPILESSSALFGPARPPGRYPDRVVALGDAPDARQFLFDVELAPAVAAGIKRGELTIGAVRMPVRLDVIGVTIRPDRSPLVWVWYLAAELARAHGLADDDSPAQLALERRYRDVFLDHGALLATDPAPPQFAARASLFVESAPYWPVRLRDDDPARLAANARAAIDFFASRAQTPFTIPIDEPRTDAARQRVVTNDRVLRAAGAGPGVLLHAVTDHPRAVYGDAMDVFISPRAVPPPSAQRRPRWTYNGRPPRAGSMVVDTEGGSLRSWGWIAFRYDVELWYAWEGMYWSDRYNDKRGRDTPPTDFSRGMTSFDERRRGGEDHGNGDGVLVYPGPVVSLRLKALRRGLLDRLLLQKLVACGGADEARAIAVATVPRALAEARGVALWPSDDRGWERARGAVLDAIVRRCPPE